jgi:hypothetical protein
MNLSRFVRKTDMAQYTLIARINAGDGEFPFVNVQFSKNHRPIPIERATYYLRPSNSGKRTPDHRLVFLLQRFAEGSSKPRESTLSVASRNRASRSGQISLARLPRYMSKWIIFERAVMQR